MLSSAGAIYATDDAAGDALASGIAGCSALVVPLPAGGATDVIARAVSQRLSEMWGQQIIVENKGGANTQIVCSRRLHAPRDVGSDACCQSVPLP